MTLIGIQVTDMNCVQWKFSLDILNDKYVSIIQYIQWKLSFDTSQTLLSQLKNETPFGQKKRKKEKNETPLTIGIDKWYFTLYHIHTLKNRTSMNQLPEWVDPKPYTEADYRQGKRMIFFMLDPMAG